MQFASYKTKVVFKRNPLTKTINLRQIRFGSLSDMNVLDRSCDLHKTPASPPLFSLFHPTFNQREEITKMGLTSQVEGLSSIDVAMISAIWPDTEGSIFPVKTTEDANSAFGVNRHFECVPVNSVFHRIGGKPVLLVRG